MLPIGYNLHFQERHYPRKGINLNRITALTPEITYHILPVSAVYSTIFTILAAQKGWENVIPIVFQPIPIAFKPG